MYMVTSAGPGSSPCHFSAMTGHPMLWLVTAFSYLVCSIECQPSGKCGLLSTRFPIYSLSFGDSHHHHHHYHHTHIHKIIVVVRRLLEGGVCPRQAFIRKCQLQFCSIGISPYRTSFHRKTETKHRTHQPQLAVRKHTVL